MPSLQDLIEQVPGLSARPDSMVSLMEIIEDPLVEARKLLPIVEHDPGLTAGLLKLCNSSLYNFKRRIGSPREALVLVGNHAFARLCFTLSLEPMLHRDLPGYNLDLDALWRHCLATAYGAAFLIKAAGFRDKRDRAFTAGLLHDVGKVVLDKELSGVMAPSAQAATVATDFGAIGDAVPEMKADSGNRVTPLMEKSRVGHDHAEVGGALLSRWNLPEEICAAVRWHHNPIKADSDHRRMALAVQTADKVAHFTIIVTQQPRVIEAWVHKTFANSAFPCDAINSLAGTIAAKHENILSLAAGPNQ